MSSFIFKKFNIPPNKDRLSDEDDRRLFFWDGGTTALLNPADDQSDNWGTADEDGIDALFYQKLDNSDDLLNQVLSVDSQGRVVNYYTRGSNNVKPDVRGANSIDLQTFRTEKSQIASGVGSALLGGGANTASSIYASVVGGAFNTASENSSFVGGGFGNTADGCRSTVSGGFCNTASGIYASVIGGFENTALGFGSSVVGGCCNTVSGSCSVVLGGVGLNNTISNTTVVQNLQLQRGTANSSFFAPSISAEGSLFPTTIQISTSVSSTVQIPADAPDGTILILAARTSGGNTTWINTMVGGQFTRKPTTAPGNGGSTNELVVAQNGTAIVRKASVNLVIISYYDPAKA
jgi:hypothetical protein